VQRLTGTHTRAGNLMKLRDGRLCLLDFGLVAEMPPHTRPVIACAIIHLAECNWAQLTENFVQLQVLPADQSIPQGHNACPATGVVNHLGGFN
jgi:predicted unusual protein kinase regulating ubiquinone biosynthesis (AarF/ABC1/UbiB family)